MYYYIFEPPKTSYERSYIERIRDVAREFGIVSEITQASPARSPEELAAMGIAKQYSTVVAVGDDSHVNRVISQLLNSRPDFQYAVGIISTDPQSLLYERWGFKKPEQACETLKFRKLSRFDLGLVEPNFYFLTSAKIECKKPTRVTLEVDHWRADAIIDRIEISNNLYILVERFIKEPSIGKTAFNWLFGKPNLRADQSIFKAKIIRVASDENLPIIVDKIVVGYTPCHIYRKPNALNIISKRDNISLEENKQAEVNEDYKEQR